MKFLLGTFIGLIVAESAVAGYFQCTGVLGPAANPRGRIVVTMDTFSGDAVVDKYNQSGAQVFSYLIWNHNGDQINILRGNSFIHTSNSSYLDLRFNARMQGSTETKKQIIVTYFGPDHGFTWGTEEFRKKQGNYMRVYSPDTNGEATFKDLKCSEIHI